MKVAVIMGSDSDFDVVKKGLEVFKKFGVESEVRVMSAHRTPFEAIEFAKNADKMDLMLLLAQLVKQHIYLVY